MPCIGVDPGCRLACAVIVQCPRSLHSVDVVHGLANVASNHRTRQCPDYDSGCLTAALADLCTDNATDHPANDFSLLGVRHRFTTRKKGRGRHENQKSSSHRSRCTS